MERSKVVHQYHDHSMEVEDAPGEESAGANQQNFPVKLHYMLGDLEADGLEHIVSWMPHGRAFVVHNMDDFIKLILPKWFRQSKFASFQRQLNLYGFKRISVGRDKGGYYHELFLRSKRFLCHRITRHKVKGQGARKASSPESEPNFYLMPYLPQEKRASTTAAKLAAGSTALPISTTAAYPGISAPPLNPSLLGSVQAATLRQLQASVAANASAPPAMLNSNLASQILQAQLLGNFAQLSNPQAMVPAPGLTLGSASATVAPNLFTGISTPAAAAQALGGTDQRLQTLLALSQMKPKSSPDAANSFGSTTGSGSA